RRTSSGTAFAPLVGHHGGHLGVVAVEEALLGTGGIALGVPPGGVRVVGGLGVVLRPWPTRAGSPRLDRICSSGTSQGRQAPSLFRRQTALHVPVDTCPVSPVGEIRQQIKCRR